MTSLPKRSTYKRSLTDATSLILGLSNLYQSSSTNGKLNNVFDNVRHLTHAVKIQNAIIAHNSKMIDLVNNNADLQTLYLDNDAKYFHHAQSIISETRTYIATLDKLLEHRASPNLLAGHTESCIAELHDKLMSAGLTFGVDPELQVVQNHVDFTATQSNIDIHIPIYTVHRDVDDLLVYKFAPIPTYYNGSRFVISDKHTVLILSKNQQYYNELTTATYDRCHHMGPQHSLCQLPLLPTFQAKTCLISMFLHNDTKPCQLEKKHPWTGP